jgi:hypothetical protein
MRKAAEKPAKRRLPKPKLVRTVATQPSTTPIVNPETGERKASASKQARVIAMLRSSSGATMVAMVQETGWQPHSVRGFLTGVVRKKLNLNLQSSKLDGQRVYRITGNSSPEASDRRSKRRAA